MNLKILLFALSAAAASSCSTTYRSGQTPDDVYYSPARAVQATVKVEKKEEVRPVRRGYTDRQIVMRTYDRRWRYFNDDYDAFYDPYRYGYNCGYYYNPYYYPSPVYISGAVFQNPKNTTPRMTNLGSYNYSSMVVVNPKTGATQTIRSTRAYNNSNNDNLIRRIITPRAGDNNSYNNSYRPADNNSRTYTPSNNNSSSTPSSGSNSGSSGTPVTRPPRN
ncbi:MAG: hypothetical protein H7258_00410 [Ferruginibacter sp.]|nr:hypothetical protein [Ferruginibacter sp.]